MAKTATINIRIEPEIKANVEKLFSSFGITVSDAVNIFFAQIVDGRRGPFDVKQPWYNVETGAAMQEAKNMAGMKEVLTIQVGDNESAKYWLSVLNELKNRGVKDILILCADGLIGLKEAISAVFPNTEYQRCIVHQVRN
mgnify:CR=1 FL=1